MLSLILVIKKSAVQFKLTSFSTNDRIFLWVKLLIKRIVTMTEFFSIVFAVDVFSSISIDFTQIWDSHLKLHCASSTIVLSNEYFGVVLWKMLCFSINFLVLSMAPKTKEYNHETPKFRTSYTCLDPCLLFWFYIIAKG